MSQISIKLLVAEVGEQEVQVDGTTLLSEIIDFIVESYSTFQGVPKQNIKLKAQQSGVYLNNLNMTAQDALQQINNQVIVVEKNANNINTMNTNINNFIPQNNQAQQVFQTNLQFQQQQQNNQFIFDQQQQAPLGSQAQGVPPNFPYQPQQQQFVQQTNVNNNQPHQFNPLPQNQQFGNNTYFNNNFPINNQQQQQYQQAQSPQQLPPQQQFLPQQQFNQQPQQLGTPIIINFDIVDGAHNRKFTQQCYTNQTLEEVAQGVYTFLGIDNAIATVDLFVYGTQYNGPKRQKTLQELSLTQQNQTFTAKVRWVGGKNY